MAKINVSAITQTTSLAAIQFGALEQETKPVEASEFKRRERSLRLISSGNGFSALIRQDGDSNRSEGLRDYDSGLTEWAAGGLGAYPFEAFFIFTSPVFRGILDFPYLNAIFLAARRCADTDITPSISHALGPDYVTRCEVRRGSSRARIILNGCRCSRATRHHDIV
jgi:hypothetical protein